MGGCSSKGSCWPCCPRWSCCPTSSCCPICPSCSVWPCCPCCCEHEIQEESREEPLGGRYGARGFRSTDPSRLVKGYEKERSVSLEEALHPFQGKISHLNEQIDKAKSRCNKSSEDGLTLDESAALYLYLDRDPGDTVYNRFQQAWDADDPAQMKPWLRYYKLLRTALDKLPNAKGEVWQAIPYDKNIEQMLQSKSTPLYASMSLASMSAEQVKEDYQLSTSHITFEGHVAPDGKDLIDNPSKWSSKVKLAGHLSADGKDYVPPASTPGSTMVLVKYTNVVAKLVAGYAPNSQTRGDADLLEVVLLYGEESGQLFPAFHLGTFQSENNGIGVLCIHMSGRSNPSPPNPTPPGLSPSPRSLKEPCYWLPPKARPADPALQHFQCPDAFCRNACHRLHAGNHCVGFERADHKCTHHCVRLHCGCSCPICHICARLFAYLSC